MSNTHTSAINAHSQVSHSETQTISPNLLISVAAFCCLGCGVAANAGHFRHSAFSHHLGRGFGHCVVAGNVHAAHGRVIVVDCAGVVAARHFAGQCVGLDFTADHHCVCGGFGRGLCVGDF